MRLEGSGTPCCICERAYGPLELRQREQGSHPQVLESAWCGQEHTVPAPFPIRQHAAPSAQSQEQEQIFYNFLFLFKSKLKINVPSALRCISLCNLPTFPHAALSRAWQGKGGKMDREREPVHPASMPVDCTSSKRETLQAWSRRWVERAQNARVPGKVEGEPTVRISSPASTLSCCRTLAKSHILSLLPFIVHNMAGVPSTAPTPWKLSSMHICLFAVPFPLDGWPWALVKNTQALTAGRAGLKSWFQYLAEG